MWYTLNDKPYDFDTGGGFNGGLFDWHEYHLPRHVTKFGKVFSDFVAPLKVPVRRPEAGAPFRRSAGRRHLYRDRRDQQPGQQQRQ